METKENKHNNLKESVIFKGNMYTQFLKKASVHLGQLI